MLDPLWMLYAFTVSLGLPRWKVWTYTGVGPRSVVLDRRGITFQTDRIQSIVTILELNDTSNRVPNTKIIVGTQILQSLHQSTSHITRLGSLDSSIDQTFSTRDSVEQEFRWCKTRVERVSDETL